MNILLTGASSFTGFWFIQALIDRGHRVCAIFRKNPSEYEGVRKQRLKNMSPYVEKVFRCSFGSKAFMSLIRKRSFDLFCHHAAQVQGYQNHDFDCVRALDQNAKNLLSVLTTLKSKGCGRIIVSGSVFEPFEGGETEGIAHSLYGLSKGLTSQVFHAYARSLGLAIGKFVIPNPFGPLEEFRFTSYLAHSWLNQKIPMLINPYNICDNIPIELLSDAYVSFSESNQTVCRPSGFVETQREFANRFASAMRPRLGLTCHFMTSKEASSQSAFKRFNQQDMVHHWDETVFWDRLAKYYLDMWGERS